MTTDNLDLDLDALETRAREVEHTWEDSPLAGQTVLKVNTGEVLALIAEIKSLRRWKAEALPVIAGLQELGNALGLPLGSRITGPEAADKARELSRERDVLREEIDSIKRHFPCDGGCSWDLGPDETCSLHGRKTAEVWKMFEDANRERDVLAGAVAGVRSQIAGWRVDGPKDEPGLDVFMDRIEAVLDAGGGAE